MLLWIIILFILRCHDTLGCRFPGSPAHSVVSFNTENIQTGTVVTYKCDSGFDLLGPLRRLCVENGTWIPQGVPVCVLNVALGKAPMQSSIVAKGVPQKAVDGSTSRTFSSDTCTSTDKETSSWWYVNLLEPFLIHLVRVDFGRACCPNDRPATVHVRVGNNRPDVTPNPICNQFNGKIEEGRPLFFPCTSALTGAFVSVHIQTPSAVSFSICEVFVYTDQVLPVEMCPSFGDHEKSATATYNGKCYMFHNNEPRSIDDAQEHCELKGGTLVHETSPALQGFLSWELYKRHRKDQGSDYWNGAVRDSDSESWMWIDGKLVTMSFWNVQPKEKNCSKFDNTKGWLWTETDCNDRLNFICQHQPISCGKPGIPPNSTAIITSTEIGSVVNYDCDFGNLLIGQSSSTCLPTGFYNNSSPSCSYMECGLPANMPNGGYTLMNGSRSYQSKVEYYCHQAYVLVGREILICDSDQKWDGPPPRCDPISCHNPPSIEFGNVTLIINDALPRTFAEYACNKGFQLIGDERISCGANGFWSFETPHCQVDKSKLPSGRLDGKQKRNRSSVTARLNMGGIIALGIFGGFVFLAVIISIVVIIIRRSNNSGDSVDSLSTYGTGGSRERLYQQQRQCCPGYPPATGHAGTAQDDQVLPSGRKLTSRDTTQDCGSHHQPHYLRQHHHASKDGDTSLETSTSTASWCPKHDKRILY